MSSQIQITGETKVKSLTGVLVGTTGVVSSLAFDVAGGVPKLDVNGKILVAQLPNSVMEYKGTWNAATNTPTLVNGTGNQGDVYLCTTAGTVDFGAGGPGPIAFVVGDQVIYSGSIWQRASGATGTVTSVAVTESGDSLNITGSPITTSGTINIGFNGTNLQYVNGAGNLTTFPILTGYVPYTGATQDVDLGAFKLNAQSLHIKGTAGNGHLGLKHQSASATASANEVSLFADSLGDLSWLNGNLYLSKFITSGNTAARSYTFPNATCNIPDDSLVVHLAGTETITGAKTFSGYTTFTSTVDITSGLTFSNSGFTLVLQPPTLSVNRTVTLPNGTGTLALTSDISYPVTSVFGRTGAVVATNGDYTTTQVTEGTNLYFTDARARAAISLTTTGTSGASTYNNTTGVLNIPQYADQFVGTVTSVAALTIGTSGTDLSSTVATSTTTPVITLNVPTASAANRGALASADWSTFNSKQGTITLTTTGTSGAATFSSNTLNIPDYGSALSGYLPLTGGALTGALSITTATSPALNIVKNATVDNRYIRFTNSEASSKDWDILNRPNANGNELAFYNNTDGVFALRLGTTGTATLTGALSGTSASFSSTVTAVGYSKFWNGSNSGLLIGNFSANAGYGAIYSQSVTPSTTNFALATNGASTVINATNDASLVTNNGNGLVVIGTGNVIINNGTTDSGYKLDVNGTFRAVGAATFTSTLLLNSASSPSAGFILFNYASNASSRSWKVSNDQVDWGDFAIQQSTTQTGSTYATKLLINATGAATFSSSVTAGGGNFVIHSNGNASIGNPTQIGTLYIAGNTTIATNANIGSNGGYMTLQSAGGNVLIGTTTDSGYKLDVNGTGRFTGALGGTSATFSGNLNQNAPIFIDNSNHELASFSNSNLQLFFSSIYDGTNIIAKAANGGRIVMNVGAFSFQTFGSATIGNAVTPTERFAISNAGAATFSSSVQGTILTATSYFTSDYYRDSRLEALLLYAGSNQIRLGSGVAADFLTFYGGGSERMRITSGGNVGIGTVSPANKLFVVASGTATTNGNNSGLFVSHLTTGATTDGVGIGSNGGSSYKWIQTYDGALALNPAGNNVLIGTTTNATGLLQVNGTIYATGFFESSSIKGKDIIATNPLLALDIDVIKYTRKSDESKDIRYGYSAEQIHSLMPELTDKDVTAVKYLDVHTILISQLQKEIKELKAKMN